jgi:hypothetical protein
MKNKNLLFETKKGRCYQCDFTDSVVLIFNEKQSSYTLKEFLVFRRMVNSVAIVDMIYDLSDNCDARLIETCKRNFSSTLKICEIIQLRELLNGTKFIIQLNSILHEILNDVLI